MSDRVERLRKAITRAEDGAGTLPAKEAVKLRPKDWHDVSAAGRNAADHIEELEAKNATLEAELDKAREALEPFAAMIDRSDALDRAWLADNAPGMDVEAYTPSSDKIVSSGEMREPVYVLRGHFRRASEVFRALSQDKEARE